SPCSADVAGGGTDVSAGGTAHNLVVSSGGTLNVLGDVSAVTVLSGGVENISSGGTAGVSGSFIGVSGTVNVLSGGALAFSTDLAGGGTNLVSGGTRPQPVCSRTRQPHAALGDSPG